MHIDLRKDKELSQNWAKPTSKTNKQPRKPSQCGRSWRKKTAGNQNNTQPAVSNTTQHLKFKARSNVQPARKTIPKPNKYSSCKRQQRQINTSLRPSESTVKPVRTWSQTHRRNKHKPITSQKCRTKPNANHYKPVKHKGTHARRK